MACRCAVLRLQAAHACVIPKLASSILSLIVAAFAEVEVPAHGFPFTGPELEAFELVRNFCRFSVIELGLLRRLSFGCATG